MLPAIALAQPCQTFTDTFSPPSPLWSNTIGSWTSAGGTYFASVPANNPLTYSGLPFDFTDFSLTVTVNQRADGGFWLHWDPVTNSGLLLVTGGGGYGQGQRGGAAGTELYFHVVTNNSFSSPVALVNNVFTPGTTHAVRVTAVGGTYSVYLDGRSDARNLAPRRPPSHTGLSASYDDQPTVGSGGGFGPPQTFSNFHVEGTLVYLASAARPTSTAVTGMIGTDADIEDFFACLAGNCPAAPCTSNADFNGDGDTGTDADIEAFFRVKLAGGNCCGQSPRFPGRWTARR